MRGPTKPESDLEPEEIPVPDGWTGGDIVHTGGNVWVRQWRSEDGQWEVGFNVPTGEGVGLMHYKPSRQYRKDFDGTVDTRQPAIDHEAAYVEAAVAFMEGVNEGGYDDEVDLQPIDEWPTHTVTVAVDLPVSTHPDADREEIIEEARKRATVTNRLSAAVEGDEPSRIYLAADRVCVPPEHAQTAYDELNRLIERTGGPDATSDPGTPDAMTPLAALKAAIADHNDGYLADEHLEYVNEVIDRIGEMRGVETDPDVDPLVDGTFKARDAFADALGYTDD